MEYIKKAQKSPEDNGAKIRQTVASMLENIRTRGESAVREMAAKFDGWSGDFVLREDKKLRLIAAVPEQVRDDIRLAHQRVLDFAQRQRESIRNFEINPSQGVRLGQRVLPMDVAGCYVPGGRFAHACSAIMSVATAKAAGVPFVVACSPPRGESIDPAVAFALDLAEADVILELGGVQAIAAMAYGLFTGRPANILVGPGNAYVAEAKALLAGSGACGIDVYAGPTESAIIADRSVAPMTIAIDLVSQAEHGPDSPVWLFTDCRELAQQVLDLLPRVIADMPDPDVPRTAWSDYGEIVLCADRDELCRVCDAYAPEHVQVMAEDLDWWLNNLHAYGSLFLGEGSTVTHGDKCSGTNHILPTRKAALHSGGLSVHKFLNIRTYQEIKKTANKQLSAIASRLSRVEGMEGHARSCDWRLRKYFPNENWDFHVFSHPRDD